MADAFSSMSISVSGMSAERQRIEVVSSNLANVNSTRTPEGGAYRRRQIVFESVLQEVGGDQAGVGVRVAEIQLDPSPFQKIHSPGHRDADAKGDVELPNVNSELEMVDLLTASRSYEANAAAFRIAREMYQRALELGKA